MQSSALRMTALGALYVAQGLPFGFFSHAVPVLLNRSHPAEIVGLSSLLAIPWGFKFLFGPSVDRLGARKRAILPLNALLVISLVALGFAHPSADHLAPLLAGFFVVSVFSAMQDVATDALALDLLAPAERGRGGAVQVGAQRAGIIAGGGGILAIIDFVGYREAFWLMAAGVAALTLPVLAVREPPRVPLGPKLHAGPSLLRSFLVRPDARAIVGLLITFKLGDALAAGMVTRWYVKQGLTNTEVALSRGLVGGLAAIAGAIAGGFVYRALGARRALLALGAMQTAAIIVYVALDVAHPTTGSPMPLLSYHAASAIEHSLGGAATAALFARMMDVSRDEARATDFTAQACVLVGITGIGIVSSGLVVKALGLRGLFVSAAVLGALAPLGIFFFFGKLGPQTQFRRHFSGSSQSTATPRDIDRDDSGGLR